MKESQTSSKKKLYLVTTDYPNAGPDSVFILPEIPELVKRFEVTVICTGGKRDCKNVRDGIVYHYYSQELTAFKKLLYVLKYPFCRQCREEFSVILKKKRTKKGSSLMGRLRKSVEFYACGEEFYRFFRKNVSDGFGREEAVFYTFWCNAYSLPLIIHKKNYPGYHPITRLHGYDLYEERFLYGRQPFKEVINAGLDKLFFVADRPMRYYLEKHPELDRDKAEVIRLGVRRLALQENRKREKAAVLVSCSNVIPLKRLELIIEALALLEEEIHWIHFGDGESMGGISGLAEKKLVNKGNISYNLTGHVPNARVRRFYEENEVDCFITASSTEGCPVSVMEALAAGIPVIGTAVGEIPSMIDGNGILLEENPTVREVAKAIGTVTGAPAGRKEEMRQRSRQIWEEYFSAEKNAPLLAQKARELLDIS